uniref:Uncharacterized protein n=1 Tax=Glossina brevipalpis TaxID=37001 RepID=A0A1A9W802_9MUSC
MEGFCGQTKRFVGFQLTTTAIAAIVTTTTTTVTTTTTTFRYKHTHTTTTTTTTTTTHYPLNIRNERTNEINVETFTLKNLRLDLEKKKFIIFMVNFDDFYKEHKGI